MFLRVYFHSTLLAHLLLVTTVLVGSVCSPTLLAVESIECGLHVAFHATILKHLVFVVSLFLLLFLFLDSSHQGKFITRLLEVVSCRTLGVGF